MKKLFLTTALCLYSTAALAGYGQDGKIYTKLDLGIGFQQIKQTLSNSLVAESNGQGHGFVGDFAVGTYLLEELRAETSFSFEKGIKVKTTTTDSNSGDFLIIKGRERSYSIFGNLYYDFLNTTSITPFISGGLGFMINEFQNTIYDLTAGSSGQVKQNHYVFGYNFGAGASYHLASNLDIDVGYKFVRSSTKKNPKFHNTKNDYSLINDVMNTNLVSQSTNVLAKLGPRHIVTIGFRSTF